jgi:homoserine O-acetyltransferase
MDLFDLGDSAEELRHALGPALCRWLFISFTTDWLYPPQASRQLVDALIAQTKPVSYCNIDSSAGHDSFLLTESMELGVRMIGAFLASLGREQSPSRPRRRRRDEATNIFDAMRVDQEMVVDLVPARASVVDLGCGNGELLSLLRSRGRGPLLGIERDQDLVAECVVRGLEVIHADLEKGLGMLADESYDVAILSQTLQSIGDVAGVLDELVRVAEKVIVSFPNFAYKAMREMFVAEGRVPKSKGFYSYEWYDTPNRRFPSILDFLELCEARGIRVVDAIYIDSQIGERITEDPNLNADVAVVALSR